MVISFLIFFVDVDERLEGKNATLSSDNRISGKWFECRRLSRLCGLIVRVRVVPRRTVVGDIDRRFDNLSGSHHQSQVNCVSSVYGIYVSG